MRRLMSQKQNSIQKAYTWNMLIEVRSNYDFDSLTELCAEIIGHPGKSGRLRS